MNYQIHSSDKSFHNPITTEQLNQVIAAISEGRYSWACVLFLRFIGYNPLHFLPQRTYSRLIKDNSPVTNVHISHNPKITTSINSSVNSSGNRVSSPGLSKMRTSLCSNSTIIQ